MPVITCRKNTHSILVSFSSDTSVRNAAKIKRGFTKLLEEPVGYYRFDLSEITETDFTFIQLLISYQNKLKSLDKKMAILPCGKESAFSVNALLCGIDLRSRFIFEGESNEHGY